MNENTLLKNIGEFNTALKDRSIDLLGNILNAPVTFDMKETKNSSFAEIQNIIGAEAISVEIPVDDNPQGMVYFANAELMPELTQYLRREGEGTAQVPQSMQLILDAADQLSALKKQIIKEKYKKDANFGNPSIVLWQGKPEEIFENGLATYFSGSIGGDKIFNAVRIIHTKVANHLMGGTHGAEKMTVKKNDFEQFSSKDIGIAKAHSIEFFNDLELEISIELGRTTMVLKDILKLSNGSVVELDKFASEFVDVYVNNKKFAEGQVVVVDQNFAVRITNLISSDEKLASVAN